MARAAWNKGISTRELGKSRPRTKLYEYFCVVCEKPFHAYPSQKKKCCSFKCSGIYRTPMISGKNNWQYKGTSDKEHLERIKFRNKMQKLLFERDNYTCQMCGQYGGYLQIDHIKRWSEYPDLRFDPENCRTLCMKCHYFVTFNKELPDGIIWGHNMSRRISP